MPPSLRSRFLVAAAPVLLACVGVAAACQICLPMPVDSLADRILAAEHLALAREDPEQPFTLKPIAALHGPAPAGEMELFLDSATRRRLARNHGESLLCGWSPERGWQRLTTHDELIAPVILDILGNKTDWAANPELRVEYFAAFLGHDDPRLSDLAHLEVARAPYGELKRHAHRLTREELLARLGNFRRYEWHALYILFLGQSEDPADHAVIRKKMTDAARFGLSKQCAAWATAFIEIDGAAALEQLEEWYAGKDSRNPEERQAILAALSVHGSEGDPALRDPIIDLIGRLLEAEPLLAPEVATVLTQWQRPDLAEPIAALLSDSPGLFDPTATLLLRRYVLANRETPATKDHRPLLPILGGLLLIPLLLAAGRLLHS